jgi:DNA-binding transcriptional LysR family regulator
MRPGLKLEFLITLDSILRNGSFAAAAKEVGLTPSAVSLQVKRLEEYLGRPLFDRSGRIAKPTPLARELATSVIAALDAVESARNRPTVAVTGRVVLGAIRTLQPIIIPLVLGEIGVRHPDLNVKVIQGDSVELLSQLKAGELDGAAIVRPSSGGSSRLLWTELEQQPFVGDKETTISDLIGRYDWLQFDTSLTSGRVAASFLHKLSPGTRARFEMESIEAVLGMVSAGLGVSIIPKLSGAKISGYPVRQIPLGSHAPTRKIAFVCRSADADNRRVSALRSAFVASYESLKE